MTPTAIITVTIGAFTSIVAFAITIKWIADTRGTLLKSSVGRAMAYLMIAIGIISAMSAITAMFPSYNLLSIVNVFSLLIFFSAVSMFGYSRSKIQRTARRAEQSSKEKSNG